MCAGCCFHVCCCGRAWCPGGAALMRVAVVERGAPAVDAWQALPAVPAVRVVCCACCVLCLSCCSEITMPQFAAWGMCGAPIGCALSASPGMPAMHVGGNNFPQSSAHPAPAVPAMCYGAGQHVPAVTAPFTL